jgi:hypothetical protein
MSGTFPTDIKPRSLQLQDNRPTLMNHAISGRRVTRAIGSQYFTLSIQLPPLNKDDAMDVFAFLQKQKNSFENFSYEYPTANRGANRTQTDITVNGAHSVGDSTIALSGFDTSTTDVLKAGDLIKFNGHSKVYMVQSDLSSDGSGNGTVLISPSLVETLSNTEAVDVDQPNFTVYLSGDVLFSTDASGFYDISFDLREVVTSG